MAIEYISYLCSPYDGSFFKGILEAVVPAMEKRGANVKVKDLGKMNFDATMRPDLPLQRHIN